MRPVLWLLIALTLLGGAAWVLLDSGRFAVVRVEITGLDRLDREEVMRSAGVRVGEPLILLDTEQVARGITADLAVARSAQVSRRWPDTVRIEVRERVAVAGVRTAMGVHLLDRDGVAFAVDGDLPQGVVPVRPVAQAAAAEAGASDDNPPGTVGPDAALPAAASATPAVSNAAVVVAALPSQLRDQVAQVTVGSPDAVDLELRDGRRVHWGGPGRAARKVLVLRALMKHEARIYDVSAPDAPTTRG